ncbi:generic methyltransferase [Arthroderma uncinatum]|uniref:generic methyltransferase n=1 Tax=Arthroderma uncinatum TaxID=74035 RepID=UPI00144AF19E|nr:generic methyltransferase [Arthroderma uncinatum]KAF3481899.1 generic methyltransferase [Arthroderma uncinatum]
MPPAADMIVENVASANVANVDAVAGAKWERQVTVNAKTAPHSLFRQDRWFTGKAPQPGVCPGVNEAGVIASLPLPNLATCGHAEVLDYFDNSWTLYETLFAGLRTRTAFYRQPDHKLRHPLIFYYGHTAAVYINKLRVAGLVDSPINAHFEALLEVGVDENSWDDLSTDETEWPELDEVHNYRAQAYKVVCDVITSTKFAAELGRPVNMDDRAWAIVLGLEHDGIHLDTSSVLIREMPVDLVSRHPAWPAPTTSARTSQEERLVPDNDMISVPAGEVVMGKPNDFPSFGWDNEYGHQRVNVDAFEASRYLISNGEFYDFVADGGYREQLYWSESGWGQRRLNNTKHPRFWVRDGPAGLHTYRLRTIFEEVTMPWDWPVCVNYHEAKAYCTWRSKRSGRSYRLITEVEHHRMRNPLPENPGPKDDPVMCHSGHELARKGVNLSLAFGSETPTDASPPTALGFGDVFGNVWQWCEDEFSPLPGFAVHPYYEDFSTPFYGGEHQLLLGGAFVSTGDEASIWGRIPFRPHFLQHSGIRLALSAGSKIDKPPKVENRNATATEVEVDNDTRRELDQRMLLHYGTLAETLGPAVPDTAGLSLSHNYVNRVVELLVDTARAQGLQLGSALDVGCAVGGTSFALSKYFDSVIGVDQSEAFIGAASSMARAGSRIYRRLDSGGRTTNLCARLDTAAYPERVSFQAADSCALPTDLVNFDVVLLANAPPSRLSNLDAFLARLDGPDAIVRPGGLILLSDEVLANTMASGSSSNGSSNNRQLPAEYELLRACDLSMLIRDNERKFQHVVPRITVWQRGMTALA